MACSSEKPADLGGRKPQEAGVPSVKEGTSPLPATPAGIITLEILPHEANRKSTLFLSARDFHLGDAKVQWFVNGEPVANPESGYFRVSEMRKGDKIQAKAVVKGTEIFSNTVFVQNAPPELRGVKFIPEVFKPGDILSVEPVAEDIDGDEVSFSYEWTRNGEPAGSGKGLEGVIKRGDRITVKVTPYDGEAYGQSKVITRDIKNMPPVIADDRNFRFDGKVWTYQVKVTDADNDPLTYSLKSGPKGMTVDPSTGFVRWEVPADFKGKESASVSVSDGHGGEAVYNFTLEIRPEQGR